MTSAMTHAATRTVDVAIVGAGVAGLTVAHDLARAGAEVLVLEATVEVGGLLRRGDLGDLAIDVGAESFATRTNGVIDLVADAGLDLEIVAPATSGSSGAHLVTMTETGIVRAPLPMRTVLGIPADPLALDVVKILGADAAARAAAERDLPPVAVGVDDEPSLWELVAQRCGTILAERLVDPLCRSVYSTPARAARLSRLHPALWEQVIRTGSLLAAADAVAAATRAGSAVAGIAGGMWRLPVALRAAAEAHGAEVRTGAAVTRLRTEPGAVLLEVDGEQVRARAVVIATGSRAAAALLDETATSPTSDAASAPVRVVAALVRSADLDAHPVGSGVIVAPGVPSAAKALTHASAKWAWLGASEATSGHVVRLSARDADAPGLDNAADLAREIALLTGVPLAADQIVAVTGARWTDAVATPPVPEARRLELERHGIHLAGAAVAGTGLASVVPHARQLAGRLAAQTLTTTSATTGSTA